MRVRRVRSRKVVGMYLYRKLKQDFYGLSNLVIKRLCFRIGISPFLRVSFLTSGQYFQLLNRIESLVKGRYSHGLVFKREFRDTLLSEVNLKSYRGLRFKYGLPVNGQRTQTNSKTAKKRNNRLILK